MIKFFFLFFKTFAEDQCIRTLYEQLSLSAHMYTCSLVWHVADTSVIQNKAVHSGALSSIHGMDSLRRHRHLWPSDVKCLHVEYALFYFSMERLRRVSTRRL